MAEVDFSDLKSATAWFKRAGDIDTGLITSRTVLRVLPNVLFSNEDSLNDSTLVLCHAALVACSRCVISSEEMPTLSLSHNLGGHILPPLWYLSSAAFQSLASQGDAQAAAKAISFALRSSLEAQKTTPSSAQADRLVFEDTDPIRPTSFMQHQDVLGVLAYEVQELRYLRRANRSPKELFNSPLWQGHPIPRDILRNHEDFSDFLASKPEWAFWRDWYLGIWRGDFDKWSLAFEVVKISDNIWNAGPEAVAAEIERIQRHLKTHTGPRLQRDQNNKWAIEPDVTIPEEPLAFAIAQVEISLTAALSGNPNNGFTKDSPETVLIRSACSDYRDMPSVVATSFWNACMSFQRNIGDVYPEDASLLVLKNVLYTSVDEICTQDELIRERIGKLAALETRRYPTAQEREDLALVPEDVKAEMTQPALDVLKSDIEIVVSTEKPPRAIRARLVNWLTTIGGGIDKAQKNEKRASWLLKLSTRIADWFFDVDGDAR
ncbi:hypothetical protein [Ascidiaceihabitans sp.]|uniref:hypothetical protein n=1 Tax=Ascidiaceihabitans sp. TaxID=1872644 RepID=UPI003296A5EB